MVVVVPPQMPPTRLQENPVNIGVDIGQKQDPSTIVVSEAMQRPTGRVKHHPLQIVGDVIYDAFDEPVLETAFVVRYMQRLPLGTDYPAVAERIAMVCSSSVVSKRPRRVLIDVTGVGRPIFDLVKQSIFADPNNQRLVQVKPITFTHGDRYEPGSGSLGKAFLVSRLQALLQTRAIQLPANHPEAHVMMQELLDYEIRIDQDANDKYGAFKVGSHDDYVTALGLSVLEDAWASQASYGPRLF